MRLDVAVEVIRHQVIVSVMANCVNHGIEIVRRTEGTVFDLVEDLVEVRIDDVRAVVVGMAKVLDIFGEVAEEEDVIFADFTGDFNLGIVSPPAVRDVVDTV